MTFTDVIILVVVLLLAGFSFYTTFIKNRHNVCASCQHASKREDIKAFYNRVRDA